MDTTTIPRPAIDGAIFIPLNLLAPSPTNPRKTFDRARLEEMAKSLQTHGQISPILVRPHPGGSQEELAARGQPLYEIVAGERRWRGAKLIDLVSLMAIVREMTDLDVLQIQLIENLEREDLEPLEEAAGYAALLSKTNQMTGISNVADLAARIGKSVRYIYNRLLLVKLCPQAREALSAGKLPVSIAQLVAGLADAQQQAEAVERILIGFGGETMTYLAALDYLTKTFMLRLDKARFMITATYKVAGPCGGCSKRSGAHGDLFGNVQTGDMCQDAKCYATKAAEAHTIELERARKDGCTILSKEKALAVLSNAKGGEPIEHRLLDQPCPALTESKHSLRDLLGPKFKPVVALNHPTTESVIYVAPEMAVRQALHAKGLLRKGLAHLQEDRAGAVQKSTDQEETPTPVPPRGAVAPPAVAAEPVKPLTPSQVEVAEKRRSAELFGPLLFTRLHQAIKALPELSRLPLQMMVLEAGEMLSHEAMTLVYKVRDWPVPMIETQAFGDFRMRVDKCTGRELGELLIECSLLAEDLSNGKPLAQMHYEVAPELAEDLGIDLKALEKQATDEAAAQIHAEQDERVRLAAQAKRDKMQAPGANGVKPKAGAMKRAVKYRNADTGDTWSGRELQPNWLKAALASGRKLEEFEQAAKADAATEAFAGDQT